jgi:hypothetical protein
MRARALTALAMVAAVPVLFIAATAAPASAHVQAPSNLQLAQRAAAESARPSAGIHAASTRAAPATGALVLGIAGLVAGVAGLCVGGVALAGSASPGRRVEVSSKNPARLE